LCAGYPDLGGPPQKTVPREFGTHKACLNVLLNSTQEFVNDLMTEMTGLFPDKYFHIGGSSCLVKSFFSFDIYKFYQAMK